MADEKTENEFYNDIFEILDNFDNLENGKKFQIIILKTRKYISENIENINFLDNCNEEVDDILVLFGLQNEKKINDILIKIFKGTFKYFIELIIKSYINFKYINNNFLYNNKIELLHNKDNIKIFEDINNKIIYYRYLEGDLPDINILNTINIINTHVKSLKDKYLNYKINIAILYYSVYHIDDIKSQNNLIEKVKNFEDNHIKIEFIYNFLNIFDIKCIKNSDYFYKYSRLLGKYIKSLIEVELKKK